MIARKEAIGCLALFALLIVPMAFAQVSASAGTGNSGVSNTDNGFSGELTVLEENGQNQTVLPAGEPILIVSGERTKRKAPSQTSASEWETQTIAPELIGWEEGKQDIHAPYINSIYYDNNQFAVIIDGLWFYQYNEETKDGTVLMVMELDENHAFHAAYNYSYTYINSRTLLIPRELPFAGNFAVMLSNFKDGFFVISNIYYVDFNIPYVLPNLPPLDGNSVGAVGGGESACLFGNDCGNNGNNGGNGNEGDDSGGSTNGGGLFILYGFNPLDRIIIPPVTPPQEIPSVLEEGPDPDIIGKADGRIAMENYSAGNENNFISPLTAFMGSAGAPLLGLGILLVLLGLYVSWKKREQK